MVLLFRYSPTLKNHCAGREAALSSVLNPLRHSVKMPVKMPGKDCGKKRKAPGIPGLWKADCLSQEKAAELLRKSSQMSGKGHTPKGNLSKIGDPRNMWRAVMTNRVEERKNKLYVEKLQKDLNLRLREIEREKAAADRFLEKLYHTTGYFPDIKFWWN